MSGRSLLDRIEKPDPSDARGFTDEAELVRSIRQNLQRILNTRHQTSSSAPDYGTSDLSGLLRGMASLKMIRSEMLASIEKYEPRLREVELEFSTNAEDLHSIYFNVTAKMVSAEGEEPAVFRSSITPGGRIRVGTS